MYGSIRPSSGSPGAAPAAIAQSGRRGASTIGRRIDDSASAPAASSAHTSWAAASEATITRLHLRYTKDTLTDDLVFKAAEPIAGGIPEVKVTGPAKENRFQGRYIVRKPFDPNQCYRGYSRGYVPVGAPLAGEAGTQASGKKLSAAFESYLRSDVPELGLKAKPAKK